MKKQVTHGLTEKADVKAEIQSTNPGQGRKVLYLHKPTDHSHGRVNKHSIGINSSPGLFY